VKLFDSHAHYNDEKFNEDRDKLLKELCNKNVSNVICAGYNIDSSEFAIELAKKHKFMYATCGISPNDIPQTEEELWKSIKKIEEISNNSKVVAIGEIGLDYYWNKENKEIQKKAFIEQIKLANKLDLPIVIHTREATFDTIDILKNNICPNKKGVFHCCPLNRELIKEALKLGFYISFAGPITFKNSKNAQEIIELVPLDRMLIETDSPYLSPEPYRGKRNDSTNLKYILEKIANVKQMDKEEVSEIIFNNTKEIFKIDI